MAEQKVIRWEEPEPPTGKKWRNLADELKEQPYMWALVYEGGDVELVFNRAHSSLKRYRCQTVMRGAKVYSRYAPDKSKAKL